MIVLYNYNFKSEPVNFEYNDYLVKIGDKEVILNILVTNKNILLFYNQERDFAVLKSKGVFVTPTYELVMSIDLNELRYVVEDDNTIINDNIIIFKLNLKEVLNQNGDL